MKKEKIQTTVYFEEDLLRKARIILIIKKIKMTDFLNQKLKELVDRNGAEISRAISKE